MSFIKTTYTVVYKNDIYYRLLKRHIQILICITRLYLIIETFNS